jgi:SRSO17 transposase
MNAQQVSNLQSQLEDFLRDFNECFPDNGTVSHLQTYINGQLSDLPRKSVEPIAEYGCVRPRTLQEFLSHFHWDHDQLRNKIEERVSKLHASLHGIGVIDDTGCPKKGTHSPGVQRQWCGATGKTDNCQVTVHISYVAGDFHTRLDGQLYLPESWAEDRDRCRSCGIPDGVLFAPKWKIALELYDRAIQNSVRFHYLTFDEGYGGKPAFLGELSQRKQLYVAEVPRSLHGWAGRAPTVTDRPYRTGSHTGRRRGTVRLVAGQSCARSLEQHLNHSSEFETQAWQLWRVKDGEKGPMVWESKHSSFFLRNDNGLPGEQTHLLIARNVLHPDKLKFFISNASPETSVGEMLRVAFSRWTVERCFEDEKMELGFDHFEGRTYKGLKRHQTICSLTHLFLAETKQTATKETPGITISQLKKVFASLVFFWSLGMQTPNEYIEKATKDLQHTQANNLKAKKSHTKRTIEKFAQLGIDVENLARCQWDSS